MSDAIFTKVLLDTGPLVAILNRSDSCHAICIETLKRIQPPLLTTWPILTEAAWLLRDQPKGLQQLYSGSDAGFFRIVPIDNLALLDIAALQKRFQTLKPQLADMTLVLLAEQQNWNTIFTLDRRDFSVKQKKTRPKLVLLPEVLN